MSKAPKRYTPTACTVEHVLEKTARRGWFLEQLMEIESCFARRWEFWSRALLARELGDAPIPQVHFGTPDQSCQFAIDDGMRNELGTSRELQSELRSLITRIRQDGTAVRTIVDWWLWACGDNSVEKRPDFHTRESHVLMYQQGMRCLACMLAYPCDWGAWILQEHVYPSGSGAAWFPTPTCLVNMMASMTFGAGDHRLKSVHEPCVGTGVILLVASNHSLDLSGSDIDRDMCAWTRLQGWLYVPWLVCPGVKIIREFRERDAKLHREHEQAQESRVGAHASERNLVVRRRTRRVALGA